MKKQWKKQAAALLVMAAAVSGTSVNAAADGGNSRNAGLPYILAESAALVQEYGVKVNGNLAVNKGYMYPGGNKVMLPLREISEAMGYEIHWNADQRSAEVTKPDTPVWTLVQTGKDEYNVNKKRLKLGSAPFNLEGKLYVPAEFFSEVFKHKVAVTGNQISITAADDKEVKTMTTSGVITAVHNSPERKAVHINGAGPEGIILNVDENTVIRNTAGERIGLEDLSLGMTMDAVHSLAMTMSLPGQTYAYEIQVKKDAAEKDLIGTSGAVTDISMDGQAMRITVKGFGMTEDSPPEVILNVSSETVIVDQEGKEIRASELKKDDKVLAFYGPVLTKSLPPIGRAVQIVVMD